MTRTYRALDAKYTRELEQLRKALAELPDLQRQAWLLCRHEALTHAEIGDRLSCTALEAEAALTAALDHLIDKVGPLIPLNYEIPRRAR